MFFLLKDHVKPSSLDQLAIKHVLISKTKSMAEKGMTAFRRNLNCKIGFNVFSSIVVKSTFWPFLITIFLI